MSNLKQGDFIELEYTGYFKGTDIAFDSSISKDQKTVVLCLGSNSLLKGLEEKLIDKETKEECTIELSSEEAFGKKDPRLIKIMQSKVFIKKNVNPIPGLQVNIDGAIATIRSISGGRCVVDFNHPLAGRSLTYKVKILRVVKDLKEKVDGVINLDFPFFKNYKLENDILIISLERLDKKLGDLVSKRFNEVIPELKTINFEELKKEKKE